jgi:hypothetical protein
VDCPRAVVDRVSRELGARDYRLLFVNSGL